jgi:hypothetical protein
MNSQETLSVISYFLQDDWESESAFYEAIPVITRLKTVIYCQDWVFEEPKPRATPMLRNVNAISLGTKTRCLPALAIRALRGDRCPTVKSVCHAA